MSSDKKQAWGITSGQFLRMIDADIRGTAESAGSYMLGIDLPSGMDGGFVMVNFETCGATMFGVATDGPMTYFEFDFAIDSVDGKLFIRSETSGAAFVDGAGWISKGIREGQWFMLRYAGRSHPAQRIDFLETILADEIASG